MKIVFALLCLFCSIYISSAAIEPGSIVADKIICSGKILHINENSTASGITSAATYTWQISPDGVNAWSDISGATSISYTSSTPVIENAYYRRLA